MRWRGCPYCGSVHVRRHRRDESISTSRWTIRWFRRCEHCGYVMEPYQKLILWHLVGEYQGGGQPQLQERVHKQKRKIESPMMKLFDYPLFDVRLAESSE